MSTAERQIQIPGESAQPAAPAAEQAPAAPVRNKPGPKPRAAAAAPLPAAPAADDLAEFDSDDLPPTPVTLPASAAEFTPDQQRLKVARLEIEATLQKHDLAGVVLLR